MNERLKKLIDEIMADEQERPRKYCRHCGRLISVKASGKFSPHKFGKDMSWCPGTGEIA